MNDITISINKKTPDDVKNPGEVVAAKINQNDHFIDIFYNDPVTNTKTRLSITAKIINDLMQNQK